MPILYLSINLECQQWNFENKEIYDTYRLVYEVHDTDSPM